MRSQRRQEARATTTIVRLMGLGEGGGMMRDLEEEGGGGVGGTNAGGGARAGTS
jgi:hypothetical protein